MTNGEIIFYCRLFLIILGLTMVTLLVALVIKELNI